MNSKRQNGEASKHQDDRLRQANSHLDALDVSSSPDFTRRVMGRLGYMRVSGACARRDRIRRWGNRAGVLLAVTVSIGLAQQFYHTSDQVRRPASLTIPAAVGNDVRQQQNRFDNMIRSIRSVVPAQPSVLPVSAPHQEMPESQQIEGDFDLPMSVPFRWV